MKHIIILGDGMADWAVPSLGNKTLLQYANTPYMDKLAQMGRTGMLKTVADGFHPGSEVANMSVMGYDLPLVYEGRGVLEAASIGVDLEPGDMAMRCNLICVEGDILKNHSAGHITTEEADQLIKYLDEKLGTDRIRFYTGVQYRHLLVIKGLCAATRCPAEAFSSESGKSLMSGSTRNCRLAECLDFEIAGIACHSSGQSEAYGRGKRCSQQHLAMESGVSSEDGTFITEIPFHS